MAFGISKVFKHVDVIVRPSFGREVAAVLNIASKALAHRSPALVSNRILKLPSSFYMLLGSTATVSFFAGDDPPALWKASGSEFVFHKLQDVLEARDVLVEQMPAGVIVTVPLAWLSREAARNTAFDVSIRLIIWHFCHLKLSLYVV